MDTGPVAVFGGTFDPVHCGHLRSALELVEALKLAQLRLMPCANPPHREVPQCPAVHRAAMVALAVNGEPRLACDGRELRRTGVSYTYDSLAELRAELGPARSLCMVVGCDALLGLAAWHRWRELLDLAHVVAIARPGWQLPDRGGVADWVRAHRLHAADLGRTAAGGVVLQKLRPLAISSSEIRQLLASGRSARYLMPEVVLDYIRDNRLYRAPVKDA